MMYQEEVTLQQLADNSDFRVGYSDDDIVIIDSIQKFTEASTTLVPMNVIAICIQGKAQVRLNGQPIELHKNQVMVIPQNVIVTDMMVSPDFSFKTMLLTNRILQSFLREKMSLWNDVMYVHRLNVLVMDDDDILFYTNFYEMLKFSIERGKGNPYHTEIIRSLICAAILGLCGTLRHMLPGEPQPQRLSMSMIHFKRFLDLLHTSKVKHRSVDSYAKELFISPKYLSSICKKHSGKTANMWITEQVMEDVRFYLRQSDLNIKQVSIVLGFPNTSFFGKYVKDHFGLTPTQLRNQR